MRINRVLSLLHVAIDPCPPLDGCHSMAATPCRTLSAHPRVQGKAGRRKRIFLEKEDLKTATPEESLRALNEHWSVSQSKLMRRLDDVEAAVKAEAAGAKAREATLERHTQLLNTLIIKATARVRGARVRRHKDGSATSGSSSAGPSSATDGAEHGGNTAGRLERAVSFAVEVESETTSAIGAAIGASMQATADRAMHARPSEAVARRVGVSAKSRRAEVAWEGSMKRRKQAAGGIKDADERALVAQALRSSTLFTSLSAEQVEEVTSAMMEETRAAGEVIILQGDDGDDLYVVASGEYSVGLPATTSQPRLPCFAHLSTSTAPHLTCTPPHLLPTS